VKRGAAIVGGAVIFAGLAVALIIGLRSPDAQSYLDPAGEALRNLASAGRDNLGLPDTAAAGNWRLSATVAGIGYVATTLLSSAARTGRGVIFTALAWVVFGFVLFLGAVA
jgi:hypothetical protein